MTPGMASANHQRGSTTPKPISALPSVQARILAFGAILVAGVCGGLIGYSAVKVACKGPRTTAAAVVKNCATPEGVGGVAGAVMAAVGVAVISVLVLRAMGEWRSIREKRELDEVIAAAAATAPRAPPAAGQGDDQRPGDGAAPQ